MKFRLGELLARSYSRKQYKKLFMIAFVLSMGAHVSMMIAFPEFHLTTTDQPKSITADNFVVINIPDEETELIPIMQVVKLGPISDASASAGFEDASGMMNNAGSSAMSQAILLNGLALADSLANRTVVTFAPAVFSDINSVGSNVDIASTSPVDAYTKNGYVGPRRGIGLIGSVGPGCSGP